MKPLLLKPAVKDYLWGGQRLPEEYGTPSAGAVTAEAWVLSCHPDGPSRVAGGAYDGLTLPEALRRMGAAALGKNAARFRYFPLLIKLIDAHDRLSVQVHPTDDYAAAHEGGYGKTEMWYVIDCEPGAELIYGFSRPVSGEEFERRIADNTLGEVLNFVPVHPGDLFFIEAGTIHAIGAGILLAEVQQNSNTTYRVSDYGRLGADGKPRPLHVRQAVEVTDRVPPRGPYGAVGKTEKIPGGTLRDLAACDKFEAKLLTVNGAVTLREPDSFVSALLLDGAVTFSAEGETFSLTKGDSVFLPAGTEAALDGNGELLISTVGA